MKKIYNAPKAEKLEFDYANVIVTSYNPADNPTGKGFADADTCKSGHPSGKTFSHGQGC